MTRYECPFTARLAADRDQALTTAEHVELREHLQRGCPHCQQERRYLDWLSRELRTREPSIDQVALQRNRGPLLAKAERQRRQLLARREQRAGALKGAFAAAALVGLGLMAVDRSPEIKITRKQGASEVKRYVEGDHSIVQLSDGRYELQISRGVFDRSVLVRLPDGEIEDLGTAFGVTIEAGRTARVSVTEGVVKLRVQGVPQRTLAAGSVWQRATPAAMPESSTASTAGASLPAVQPQNGSAGQPATAQLTTQNAGITTQSSSAKQERPRSRSHPSSGSPRTRLPRTQPSVMTEDAMYLRVLDLLREDRPEDARALAARYLSEFPQGFRRREVAAVAAPQH